LPPSCHGLAMILPCLGLSLPCSCHAIAMISLCPCDGNTVDVSAHIQQQSTETHLGVPDFIGTIGDNRGTPRRPQRATTTKSGDRKFFRQGHISMSHIPAKGWSGWNMPLSCSCLVLTVPLPCAMLLPCPRHCNSMPIITMQHRPCMARSCQ
jgi:hypothetical protein